MPTNPFSHMLKVPSGMKPSNESGLISMANPSPAWEVSIQKAKAKSVKVEKGSMRTRTERARGRIWEKAKALDPGQRPEAVSNVGNEVNCPPTVPIVTNATAVLRSRPKVIEEREMEKERVRRKERRMRKEIKVERVK